MNWIGGMEYVHMGEFNISDEYQLYFRFSLWSVTGLTRTLDQKKGTEVTADTGCQNYLFKTPTLISVWFCFLFI